MSLVLLFLAFILELFGANPNSGIAQWVYGSVERTTAPFRGLFEPITFGKKSVLDTSLLFATIVYGFVALFLKAAIDWVTDASMKRHVVPSRASRQREGDLRNAAQRTTARRGRVRPHVGESLTPLQPARL